ncbi:MAG: zinc metalloprotease HtpX [Nanoarchaeota archaeon]
MNQLKTVILLGLLTALLLFVGQLIGGYNGLIVAGIFAVIMNFGSYWFSDKIVLMMYGAKEVKESEAHKLYKIVREVAEEAKVPMPKVYIINMPSPNMFATGRNPKHAAVAASQSILELLNDGELKGVVAHEIAHIKNRDILISTIAGTIAGVISYVATMAQWTAMFGGLGGRDRNNNSNIISLLVLAIVTPIIASLIQLAISRSREYIADASGARILRDSTGLASALEKIESSVKNHPLIATPKADATAHLFIVNPFRSGAFIRLFMTHPPTKERIKKLNEIKF